MLPSLLLDLRHDMYEWITIVLLVKQNGTLNSKDDVHQSPVCLVIANPGNLEHLLKTNFFSFPKGEFFGSIL
ncbi:hypothetical protein ZOSMA_51G00090 [Zostera marina]|uniref:Uncharacterized protein n=1 Tax=Zostera marina TaxID=29655 RepID=A0A0K9NXQ0_ZOSMR|nr:hypothetical protein ZOSMA_51G00090 [Zostera marina]